MNEKWEEFYTVEQLRKLQDYELDNLRVFISVCEKLGLEYILYGGTLLGAVKYSGFIPWDDDVDVALPRESYERFIKEAPQILPEEYFIQNPYNCTQCPYPYTKLRRKGTQYVEYVYRNLPIETGVYIDIYPVDHIPDDERKRHRQFKIVRKWINMFVLRQSRPLDQEGNGIKQNVKKIIKAVLSTVLKVFPAEYYIKHVDRYMQTYNNDSSAHRYGALNSPLYDNIYNDIYPLVNGKFENLDVNMPHDYTEHLTRRYGDISTLPPAEERVGHIPYILTLE